MNQVPATDPIFDPLRLTLNRNLLRWAVGQAITCRWCDDILDQARAVLVTAPREASWLGCAKCWGKGPFQVDAGGWAVLDGRILFRPAPRAKRSRKVAR